MLKKVCSLSLSLVLLTGCGEKEKYAETEDLQARDPTTKNLLYAFAGECQANRKYLAFAKVADQEGYPGVARLWRAAAAAEAIHARNHLDVLGLVKSTEGNLQGAVEGEQDEFTTMYPKFIKTAEEAGRKDAAQSMQWAFKVEQLHYNMFLADLDELKKGENPADSNYWVCRVCGNTVPDAPPEQCDICGSPQSNFFKID
ncbi:MAG: rubrerythrin family protein [Verrucomicrobia bacterium]|nr:rubrerythrin family protein [Verrucomicrobiota bacterium]